MDKKRAFGQFIYRQRMDRGITQSALATAVGISRPYLSQIEGGKRLPNDETFQNLLFALGASFEEFTREFLTGEIEQEQVEAAAELVRGLDAMRAFLTPEQMMQIAKVTPPLENAVSSLATLGGSPLPTGPEGWLELRAEDRKLVQRIVNRLRSTYRLEKETDDGDEEA